MRIFGLYGKSGTGKSHRASEVVSRYHIDAVIDDGILIMNKMRVAGQTAKNERSMHAATKRAIFFSNNHRDEVRDSIRNAAINRILLIGTSQKMIRRIAERLDLAGEVEWIPIESLQSHEELILAKERRNKGYHVIPIRPVEVEKTYYGAWFRKLIIRMGKRKEEVTLVKPLYLTGKITIQPQCIRDIVLISATPEMRIHSVIVEKEKVLIALSMQQGLTVENLREWKRQLSDVLANSLEIVYAVEIEWRAVIPSNRVDSGIRGRR